MADTLPSWYNNPYEQGTTRVIDGETGETAFFANPLWTQYEEAAKAAMGISAPDLTSRYDNPWAIDAATFHSAVDPYIDPTKAGGWYSPEGQSGSLALQLLGGKTWTPSGANSGITYHPAGELIYTQDPYSEDPTPRMTVNPYAYYDISGDMSAMMGQEGTDTHADVKYVEQNGRLVPVSDPATWQWESPYGDLGTLLALGTAGYFLGPMLSGLGETAAAGTLAGEGLAGGALGGTGLTAGSGTLGLTAGSGTLGLTAGALDLAPMLGTTLGTGSALAGTSLAGLGETAGAVLPEMTTGGTGLLSGGTADIAPTLGSSLETGSALTGTTVPEVTTMGSGTGLTAGSGNLGLSATTTPSLTSMGGGTGLLSGATDLAPALGTSLGTGSALTGTALEGLSGLTGTTSGTGGTMTTSGLTSLLPEALQPYAGLLGTGANLLGGYLSGESAQQAAQTQSDAIIKAAQIAADAAKFKPVGVTTGFGSSNFGYDANGNLISAGYTLTPEMQAQQQQLLGASGGLLNQFTGAQGATAPMSEAARRAMALGQGYLATSPQEQAAKYMADQQALLATGRERDLSGLMSKLQAQGRMGLATGATSTGMGAANPMLEAYYNAQRQQDLGLAAQATQGGMDYAKFGAGMVGTGGDLLSSMYGVQSAAYNPYKTALGGAQTIEGLGQNAMDLGINIGAKGTAGAATAGNLLGSGMASAAGVMAPANAYSPWGSLLSGAGSAMQQYKFDPMTGKAL